MKKVLVIILGVLNVALLTVIIVSLATGWRFSFFKAKQDGGLTPAPPVTAASVPATTAPDSQPPTEDTTATEETETTQEQATEATTAPTQPPTQPPTQAPTQKPTQAPTQAPTKAPSGQLPSPNSVSTNEKASKSEMEQYDWEKGWKNMSKSAVRITDFSAVTGGWKGVIITDPFELMDAYTTDLVNVSISGSASDVKISMSWGTRYFNSTGKSVETKSTPSSFSGTFSKGSVVTVGSGKLEITSFYYDNGREYAIGVYTWPDGLVGYVGLTRP